MATPKSAPVVPDHQLDSEFDWADARFNLVEAVSLCELIQEVNKSLIYAPSWVPHGPIFEAGGKWMQALTRGPQ